MRKFLATAVVGVLLNFASGGTASAQDPYRGSNTLHGAYISGWPIYGTYIAPPTYAPVRVYQPTWAPTYSYPVVTPNYSYSYPVVTMPNYSSGIPTNYNYDWRWYRR